MKHFKILALTFSLCLITFTSNAQTDAADEGMNLNQDTDSITLDGSDLEMTNTNDSELEESADLERIPASETPTEIAPSAVSTEPVAPTESDIGELTLTPEDEQMAEAAEPKADTLPIKTEEEQPVQPMATIEESKSNTANSNASNQQAASSANAVDLGPVVGDQKYKITCQLNDDIREITAIQQADGSVGVVYKRFDTVKTIAIARRDPAYADQVVDKIYNNLANGKYPYACKKD